VNALTPAEAAARNVPAKAPAAADRADLNPFDQLPLPYVEIDAHGIITSANRACLALHHLANGELIGRMAWDLVATDEKDPSFAAYCSTLESGDEPAVVRRSLYDRSGQFRTYEIFRRLIHDPEGNPAGMRMICVDVTDAKNAFEDARRSSVWLQSVLDSICEAIVVTDSLGFIRSANPAAEALLGWKASELTGVSIEEGLPIQAFLSGDRSELTFSLSLEKPAKATATILDRERREMHVEIGSSPIYDKENDSTTGVVLILRKLESAG
jgi:PAS domain S-box-containing protein